MRNRNRQHAAQRNKLFLFISFLFFSIVSFSQTISGVVTDADKKPISRVTVHVKGANNTTTTDEAGRFSIPASENDVLVFTYIGYFTQEVPLNGKQSVNVSMAIDTRNMENVVVTARNVAIIHKIIG